MLGLQSTVIVVVVIVIMIMTTTTKTTTTATTTVTTTATTTLAIWSTISKRVISANLPGRLIHTGAGFRK